MSDQMHEDYLSRGLTIVDLEALQDFHDHMEKVVIPRILEDVYLRQKLAEESRKWIIKT